MCVCVCVCVCVRFFMPGKSHLVRLARDREKVMSRIREYTCTHEDMNERAAEAIKEGQTISPEFLSQDILREATVVACTSMGLGHPMIFLARCESQYRALALTRKCVM